MRAGVDRVIVSCSAGQAKVFEAKLSGLGAEIVAVAETEPLGRGGGLRLAAKQREESGPLYAFNGDELHDVDLRAFLEAHEEHGGAATIVVAPLTSQFGVVELADGDRISGFREAPRLPALGQRGRVHPRRRGDHADAGAGDHEQSTFPELAAEGKLFGFRRRRPLDHGQDSEGSAAGGSPSTPPHPELRPTPPAAATSPSATE